MSNLLVLLVLLMTTFLSSLFSPARGQDGCRFSAFLGGMAARGDQARFRVGRSPVPPGGVLDLPPPFPIFGQHTHFRLLYRRISEDCQDAG